MNDEHTNFAVKVAILENQIKTLREDLFESKDAIEEELSDLKKEVFTKTSIIPYLAAIGVPVVATLGWFGHFTLVDIPEIVQTGTKAYVDKELTSKASAMMDARIKDELPKLVDGPISEQTARIVDDKVPSMLSSLVDTRVTSAVQKVSEQLEPSLKKSVDESLTKLLPEEVKKDIPDIQKRLQEDSNKALAPLLDQRIDAAFSKKLKPMLTGIQVAVENIKQNGFLNIETGTVSCGRIAVRSNTNLTKLISKEVKFKNVFRNPPVIFLSLTSLDASKMVRSNGPFGEYDNPDRYYMSSEKVSTSGFQIQLSAQANSVQDCRITWIALEGPEGVKQAGN